MVEFPNGTPLETTQAAVDHIEQAIRRVDEQTETLTGESLIQHMYSLVGSTISDDRPKHGSNLGAVRVELLDAEKRGVYREDILVAWEEEIGAIPGTVALTFEGSNMGPPGGAYRSVAAGPRHGEDP